MSKSQVSLGKSPVKGKVIIKVTSGKGCHVHSQKDLLLEMFH